jgi:hypothetical protein
MTMKEVLTRATERWAHKPIPLPQVELIPAERLETPLTGERICKDRWNINLGGMAS